MATSDLRLRPSRHVSFRQFDDELVILDLAEGSYFALNEVGARIWRELAEGATPSEIAASLAPRYEVDVGVVLADCLRLVDQLLEQKLVERVDP